MREWIQNIREVLRSSLWFTPSLFTLVAIVIALLLLEVDRHFPIDSPAYIFAGGPAGAREILSTIATSVITVAGVAFSITIVVLSLAASQYGPLLLASYLRDAISQSSLGMFVGTFVYCLIVLGNVSESGETRFLPSISVAFSFLLALASLAMFVAFIHHLAQSMRPDQLAARVGEGLVKAINEIFSAPLNGAPDVRRPDDSLMQRFENESWPVQASRNGYLQAIEWDSLMALAERNEFMMRVWVRPGDFVAAGTVLGQVVGGQGMGEHRLRQAIMDRLLVGHIRMPTQDPEYTVHQLAQVAVRALSPGINDPYTALICIDWLEAALRVLAGLRLLPEYRFGKNGALRLVALQPNFELIANASFNKLRHAGRSDLSILLRLTKAASNVAAGTKRESDRETLTRVVLNIREDGQAGLPTERERHELDALCERALKSIGEVK